MFIVSVLRWPFRLYMTEYENGVKFSSFMSDAIKFPTYKEADLASWGISNRKIINLEDVKQ